jgi:uncharacterized protein
MPMFPLGSVLFPSLYLPLHVFEPRYRALVQRCLEGDSEFGVVLIERGWEVGGGDVRTGVGTVARILQVAETDDGRYALGTLGTRRIRVVRWLEDDPYPRAVVEDHDDVGDGGLDDVRSSLGAALPKLRRLHAQRAELGEPAVPLDRLDQIDPDGDPVLASYQASALALLGPADAQSLLAEPGPAARLARLHALLDDELEVLALRLQEGSPDA